MDGTDGLTRGKPVVNTGKPITIPVGTETLGRIMNVIGEPVDEAGEIGELLLLEFIINYLRWGDAAIW